MSNKIGYKTESIKRSEQQIVLYQEPQNENESLNKNDILRQLGYEKANDMLIGFLTGKRGFAHGDVLARELTEIRKHFFEKY